MELSVGNERVAIPSETGELEARLWLPAGAQGLVILAGENRRQRLRPTGDYLPSVFGEARLATLAFDVSGACSASVPAEDVEAQLCACVLGACAWVRGHEALAELPLALVGIGRGAVAVLESGARLGRELRVLVARGMHCAPGLAGMQRIHAPTLLIAGGLDEEGMHYSRIAYTTLRCPKRFEIVPGATRAFDEPGSLEVVARLARSWLVQHLH